MDIESLYMIDQLDRRVDSTQEDLDTLGNQVKQAWCMMVENKNYGGYYCSISENYSTSASAVSGYGLTKYGTKADLYCHEDLGSVVVEAKKETFVFNADSDNTKVNTDTIVEVYNTYIGGKYVKNVFTLTANSTGTSWTGVWS